MCQTWTSTQSYPEGREELGTSPLTLSKPNFLLLFILISCLSTEWMFVSIKMGSQGEHDAETGLALQGGLSGPVNRWGERGLHSSGEASAHPVLPSLLSQLSAGVTVTSLNTSSWWRCGWRVATGLTQCPGCLQSACCTLACKAVSLCLQCYNEVRCREE